MPKDLVHASSMTKSEQADLLKVIRARTRVAKEAASARAAGMKAGFEQALNRKYHFDEREIWRDAYKAASRAADEAHAQVHAECERLNIPRQFAPRISAPIWFDRGENGVKEERTELRRLAHAEIAAIEKRARAEIERLSCEVQEDLVSRGMSATARVFLERMPSPTTLMPSLEIEHIERQLFLTKGRNR